MQPSLQSKRPRRGVKEEEKKLELAIEARTSHQRARLVPSFERALDHFYKYSAGSVYCCERKNEFFLSTFELKHQLKCVVGAPGESLGVNTLT